MNHKQRAVISSYSDVSKLSSKIRMVHFRKFLSSRMLDIALKRCPNLEMVSLSVYASKRLNSNIYKLMFNRNIELKISRHVGRPSVLEQRLFVI
ncbi:MAG: hypothetical protein V1678_00735 [Candidatus Aenigmatarchaeota archaeon]